MLLGLEILRLIKEENIEALASERSKVAPKSSILIWMKDCWMVFMPWLLFKFNCLNQIFRVPLMIDSSKWELSKGLKVAQGKSIVNSISQRRRRELYSSSKISKTVRCRSDYNGIWRNRSADNYERRIEICKRSYDILVDIGFLPKISFLILIFSGCNWMDEH
jgi:5-methyltetrahydrofolate--homocysteine methyltransferase